MWRLRIRRFAQDDTVVFDWRTRRLADSLRDCMRSIYTEIPMLTIAVISKPQKPDLAPILHELVTWIRERGFEPILDPVSGSYVQSARIVPRQEMANENPERAI